MKMLMYISTSPLFLSVNSRLCNAALRCSGDSPSSSCWLYLLASHRHLSTDTANSYPSVNIYPNIPNWLINLFFSQIEYGWVQLAIVRCLVKSIFLPQVSFHVHCHHTQWGLTVFHKLFMRSEASMIHPPQMLGCQEYRCSR